MVNVLHRSYSAMATTTSTPAASTTTTTSCTSSSSASNDIVCNCQYGHCTKRRGYRSSVPMTNNMFLMIMLVSLSYFTCCISAWPILNHRRSAFNIMPPLVVPAGFDMGPNPWAMAAPQQDTYYEMPSDDSLTPQQDVVYQDDQIYEDPEDDVYNVWPLADEPVLDDEEPEELELEALKQQQPYAYQAQNKRRFWSKSGSKPTEKPAAPVVAASALPKLSSSTPKPSESPLVAKLPTVAPSSSKSDSVDFRKRPAATMLGGQKEFAMLRPPSAKSHFLQIDEAEEPKISVAQRSPSNEKPSAYDRLRKVLSLDDALKKEYQQRRANSNRHSKRESPSSIITDSDSLTGQLNSLKKKID